MKELPREHPCIREGLGNQTNTAGGWEFIPLPLACGDLADLPGGTTGLPAQAV